MNAISSYRGNRPTHKHRQDRLQYTVPQLARSVIILDCATDDRGDGGDDWNSKMCKTPVKSSPPVNHHSFYSPDALPVTQPTASKHWRQTTKAEQPREIKQQTY